MLRKLLLVALSIVVLGIGGLLAVRYLASAETFTNVVLDASRAAVGLTRKEITLPDGLHYAYLEGGTGEPLLLLHGFGADKDDFLQIAPYLSKRYHLIIPDHIGFGESSKPPELNYGPDAQAKRLHALLLAIGVTGPVHVGGNSMGGMITIHYGLNFPADTISLWLLNPVGATSSPPTDFMATALKSSARNPLEIHSTDDMAFLVTKAAFKPPYIPRPMIEVMAKGRIANQALEKKVFVDMFGDNTEKRLADIAMPTLIVWGDKDEILHPAGADIMKKLIPFSKMIMMHDVGHMPMIEDPARSASDFLQFEDALNSVHQTKTK